MEYKIYFKPFPDKQQVGQVVLQYGDKEKVYPMGAPLLFVFETGTKVRYLNDKDTGWTATVLNQGKEEFAEVYDGKPDKALIPTVNVVSEKPQAKILVARKYTWEEL